eukprot:508260_1
MSSYNWTISDASMVKKMKSAAVEEGFLSSVFSMHGFKWYMKIYTNGASKERKGICCLYFYLAALPSKVKSVTTRRKLIFVDTTDSRIHQFTQDKMYIGWPTGTLKTAEIQNYNELTFRVESELIIVEDKHGNDIVNEYLTDEMKVPTNEQQKMTQLEMENKLEMQGAQLKSITNQIELMTKSINGIQNSLKDIKLQINEEQKVNGNNLQKQINELKINMKALSLKGNKDKLLKDKHEFKDWVENTLKLPEYYQHFVEHGIQTLDVVQMVTINELKEMNITKIGHRMLMLREIAILKQKININYIASEGNVLMDTN